MRVGCPKEIKVHEYRVGLTPESAAELVRAGHEVFLETKAGEGIGAPDSVYEKVGVKILPDADAVFKRAIDAGATVRMAMADMFWGDRYGVVTDPFGHHWSIATHIRDLSPEEIKQEMMKSGESGD